MQKKKSVQLNFVLNLIDQFFSNLVPLIIQPVLTYALTPNLIGVNTKVLTFSSWFMFLAAIGIPLYGSRKIAQVSEDKHQVSQAFSKIFSVQFVWGLMILLAYIVTVQYFISDQVTYKFVYYIPCLLIINCMLDTTWLFNGNQLFAPVVIRASAVKIVSFIAILLFVKEPKDYWVYLLIYCGSLLAGQLYTLSLVPQLIEYFKIDLSEWRHILQSCFVLFLPQISIVLFTLTDNQLLSWMMSEQYVGFYGQAVGFIKVPVYLLSALGVTMLPHITHLFESRQHDAMRQHLRSALCFTLYLAIPLTFGVAGVSSNLITWYLAPGFEIVGMYMMFLAPTILTMSLGNVFGKQTLLPMNLTKQYSLSITIAALVNLILDLVLIPLYGVMGCIVATLVAELLIVAIQLYYVRAVYQWKLITYALLKYIVAGLMMYLVIAYVLPSFIHGHALMLTLAQVGSGIFIYGSLLLLLKDDVQYNLLSQITNKISVIKKVR